MFPNFTGSSRKTRNVNLSGQRAINPFTNASFAGAPTGASKTVAQAQAERQQRQRERERLKAALGLQRVWRGYRVRRALRDGRRQLLDEVYTGSVEDDVQMEDGEVAVVAGAVDGGQALSRSIEALPLLFSVYQTSNPGDYQRLRRVLQDLIGSRFGAFSEGGIASARLKELVRIVVAALASLHAENFESDARLLLESLCGIVGRGPQVLEPVLAQYYTALGRYCRQAGPARESLDLLHRCVVAPLSSDHTTASFNLAAYHAFAFHFLAQSDLTAFQQDAATFAADIDMERLSESIIGSISKESKTPGMQTAFLWLLAHFIDLHRAKRLRALQPRYINTLYLLLCVSSQQIRERFGSGSRGSRSDRSLDSSAQEVLPPYVVQNLDLLINKDEISELLKRFTTNHGHLPDSEFEDASFLAGYILTLVYCFPALADDIRMRLYLADISTRKGPVPAVKFFWTTVTQTSIFPAIVADENAAADVLQQQRRLVQPSMSSQWHREWRTVLLFLELYVFVLRLTDDDDFFASLDSIEFSDHAASRLRQSGLAKQELMRLATFLKHLGFTLHYNPPSQLYSDVDDSAATSILDDFLVYDPKGKSADTGNTSGPQRFVVTAGIDFTAFKDLVSSAMKMLYERDSRRRFLPEGHWLMTSKFNMNEFLGAVVLEEEKRRELQDGGDDDDEDTDSEGGELDPTFAYSAQRLSRLAHIELMRVQQKRAARERTLAAHAPKLQILRNMPFVIPFETRVEIFRQFVNMDMCRRRGGDTDPDRWRMRVLNQHGGLFDPLAARGVLGRHQAQITRGRSFTDGMDAFWALGDRFKEPIQISFVDEFGMEEAGIDGGGVTKEFLTSVMQEAFDEAHRWFVPNSKNAYYPNPYAIDQEKHLLRSAGVPEDSDEGREKMTRLLREYEFLGRVIGKCLYEGILINITFAGFFLLKWAAGTSHSYRANINDLRELDEELYQGMMQLKNYPGDIKDLELDFTINDQVSSSGPLRTVARNLIPNGASTAVTNENRPLYISYVARHRLLVQPYQQTRAFLRGLNMIIEPDWLSMFNQNELQRLVGGDSSEIDVEDMRRNTVYSGVYAIGDDGEEHPTIRLFWEVMRDLKDEERREVLQYVTSTPRAPLLGFSQLRPAFSIRDNGQDEARLPSASTCINLLKLPQYTSAATLRGKLLYAVKSRAGFDLS